MIVLSRNILLACMNIILNSKFLIFVIKEKMTSMPFDYHNIIKVICAFGLRKRKSATVSFTLIKSPVPIFGNLGKQTDRNKYKQIIYHCEIQKMRKVFIIGKKYNI